MLPNSFQQTINDIILDENYQTISFQMNRFSWRREELFSFIEMFFQLIKQTKLIEVIEGADRLNVRFYYLQEEYLLTIECLSESLWIEKFTYTHQSSLSLLYKTLEPLLLKDSNE